MNQLVVHGQLVDKLGHVQQRWVEVGARDRSGYQPVEYRTRSFALPPESFLRMQPAVALNLEHDKTAQVGRLTALERGADGALWATFTSEVALLRSAARPWYLSAEAVWSGDGEARDVELFGVALVRDPGAVGIRPAMLLPGRLDRRQDRARWRLAGEVGERLERAAAQLPYRKPDHPVSVHDYGPERQQQLRQMERATGFNRYRLLVEDQERRLSGQRPRGPVRHGPPGRVLAVR